jgi:hypothetical protein
MIKKILVFALISGFGIACQNKEIGPQWVAGANDGSGSVLVINEGNFQWGNASLGLYDPQTNQYTDRIYQSHNQQALGDVFQAVDENETHYFLSLNGSNQILKIDKENYRLTASRTGSGAPRFIEVSQGLLFCSDLYQPVLTIYDANELQIVKSLRFSEALSGLGSGADYLLAQLPNELQVISIAELERAKSRSFSGQIVTSLQLADSLAWVLVEENNRSQFFKLSLPHLEILDSLSYPATDLNHFAVEGEQVWAFNAGGMYHYNPTTEVWDSLASWSLQRLYGFAHHSEQGEFYLSDALDFNQASVVRRYDLEGQQIGEFEAGRICNGFFFP